MQPSSTACSLPAIPDPFLPLCSLAFSHTCSSNHRLISRQLLVFNQIKLPFQTASCVHSNYEVMIDFSDFSGNRYWSPAGNILMVDPLNKLHISCVFYGDQEAFCVSLTFYRPSQKQSHKGYKTPIPCFPGNFSSFCQLLM